MKTIVISSLIALTAVACGQESESDTQNKINLQGTWTAACALDEEDEDEGSSFRFQDEEPPDYMQESLTFTETAFTVDMSRSKETDCTDAYMTMKMEGTYKAGADASSQTETEGATAIDIALSAVTLTFTSDDLVNYANGDFDGDGATDPNETAKCTVKVQKSVAVDASKCDLGGGGGGPKPGETWKSIFKATETDLYFGDEDGGQDANGRDKALAASKFQKK